MRWLITIILLFGLTMPVIAVLPDEILDDPVLEARARDISKGLRCLVCQNQNIDDSDASLARDLRLLVRERLVAGDADTEVLDYVVSRYGEFVLLNPTFGLHTLLLWFTAPLVLLIGIVVLIMRVRLRKAKNPDQGSPSTPMTNQEQDVLKSLK